MRRMDYLDQHRKGLFEVALESTCPISECQRTLVALMCGGSSVGSCLVPVFDHFAETLEDYHRLQGRVRGVCLDFGAQIKWRFAPLKEMPFKMSERAHPGLSR